MLEGSARYTIELAMLGVSLLSALCIEYLLEFKESSFLSSTLVCFLSWRKDASCKIRLRHFMHSCGGCGLKNA